jgi:hypothetical protein
MSTAVSIVARSLLTALGADAQTSCASARAGLVRTELTEGMRYSSTIDGKTAPIVVCAVPLITSGFEGRARLERLLATALAELKIPVALGERSRIACYMSVPSERRHVRGLELMSSDSTRALYAEMGDELAMREDDPAAMQTLLATAASQAGLRPVPDLRLVSYSGHAGGIECIAAAMTDLDAKRVDLAIVCGLDSLLDESTMAWLNVTDRLKLPDMPVGMRPGEACALVGLARPDHPCSAGSPAEIIHVGQGFEERTLLSGKASVGSALAELLDGAGTGAGWNRELEAWIVSDQNGETYRAMELAYAVVRTRERWPALGELQVWIPAESFGDTGSASAIVGVCVAMAAFERGYAPGRSAVVASASDAGARGALVLAGRSAAFHEGRIV